MTIRIDAPTARRLALALCLAVGGTWAGTPAQATERNARDLVAAAEHEDWSAVRLHRNRGVDPLVEKYANWLDYQRKGTKASFAEIAAFLDDNPDWPRRRELQINAEAALHGKVRSGLVRDWFDRNPPLSGHGALAHLDALRADGDATRIAELAPRYWIELGIDRHSEKAILRHHGKHITRRHHAERLDRLIWIRHHGAARRMLRRVDPDIAALARARIALMRRTPGVDRAIARVPENLRDAPELWYERLRWRRRTGKDERARDILFDLTGTRPYPEKWSLEGRILARRALADGHYSEAVRLVSGHGLSGGVGFAESEFLSGWILLSLLEEPDAAERRFENLYRAVQYPISRARGAYWTGRAAAARGDALLAEAWWRRAAGHPATFYGQQAAHALGDGAPGFAFAAPSDPDVRGAFVEHELVRLVQRLHALGADTILRTPLLHLAGLAASAEERLLVVQLAREVDRPREAVRAAKRANQLDNAVAAGGYPLWTLPKLKRGKTPEEALVLALIRQESEFDSKAISGAGARGMMQLMPATAKRVAASLSVPYSRAKLTSNPDYNIRLGSTYLASMLDRFRGSVPLALAAYNAGPHRVARWLREFGDPRTGATDMLDWIEAIPFKETRNYVQRVLEAVPVYRRLLDDTQLAATGAAPLSDTAGKP